MLRVNDWIKNLLVIAPAFFALAVSSNTYLLLLFGFFSFCFLSCAGYILNDYLDVEYDRKHPEKKLRAYANRNISAAHMAVLFSLCLFIGFGLGAAVNGTFLIYAFAYVIITACYSLFLKNIPYVDSLTIVSGFIVRAFAGGAIVNVAISHWLLLMLVCITIFLAFAKRKTEVHLYLEKQIAGRKVIGFYNLKFTNLIVIISSILSVVVYVLYTTDKKIIAQFGTAKLFWTALPVFIGIARYNYLLFKPDRAANPAKMFLTDAILCITFVSWISIFGILIYG